MKLAVRQVTVWWMMASRIVGGDDRRGVRGFPRPPWAISPHRGRDNAAVACRYLRGLAQAEDCTFESMAAVVEDGCAQQFQHFISNSPWDHEPVLAQIGRDADALLAASRRAR